ncbi:hypothetical protein GVAV_002547 [Gurleya vavrai]
MFLFNSLFILFEIEIAAKRLGCVIPIIFELQNPFSKRNCGICVDLPLPVSL